MRQQVKKIFGLLLLGVFAFANSSLQAAEFREGEVIVKYRSDFKRTKSAMNAFYQKSGVIKVRRLGASASEFELLTLKNGTSVLDAVQSLNQLKTQIEYAQPNFILRVNPIQLASDGRVGPNVPCIPGMDVPNCDPTECWIPGVNYPPGCKDGGGGGGGGGGEQPPQPPAGRPVVQDPPSEVNPPVADPQLSKAYGIEKVQANKVWDELDHKGNKDMIVAVIDTGVDYNHQDLSFNMWRNPNPGAKGDVVGFDFVHNDGLPFDDHKHGTHCAGTVGAVGSNGVGVSGVSQRVSIMALKFLSAEGGGTTSDAIRAIDYAVEKGARVLSNSWGGKGDDGNDALLEAIKRAEKAGVLFIAAAGNDGTNNDEANPSYPAAFDAPNLISVAATDKSDKLAYFSNFGKKTTHLAAPGVNVYSTTPGNTYGSLSGTSMACPHVAGAAALLWSKNPHWNYLQVKDALLGSVDPLPVLNGKTKTGGRLNVYQALRTTE